MYGNHSTSNKFTVYCMSLLTMLISTYFMTFLVVGAKRCPKSHKSSPQPRRTDLARLSCNSLDKRSFCTIVPVTLCWRVVRSVFWFFYIAWESIKRVMKTDLKSFRFCIRPASHRSKPQFMARETTRNVYDIVNDILYMMINDIYIQYNMI